MAYQNFFTTRLFAEIGAADSVITLETPPVETSGRLVLESRNPTQREIIRYTGLSGNQITGVLRGQGGTSAKPHLKNSLVEMNVTAEDLEDALGAPDNLSQYMREALSDFVVPGTGNIAKTTLLTGSFADIVYYIGGLRYQKTSIPNRAYTASRDTYVFISIAGTITYTPVANGAAAPSTPADSILVAVVTTNATEITTVVLHNRGAVKSQNVDFATFGSQIVTNRSSVNVSLQSLSPVTVASLTVGVSGRYIITGNLLWNVGPSPIDYEWKLRIDVNGVQVFYPTINAMRSHGGAGNRVGSFIQSLNAGDVVTLMVTSGGGPASNGVITAGSSSLSIVRV